MTTRFNCMVVLALVGGTVPACNWEAPQPSAESAGLPAVARPDPWITTQLQGRYFADPVVRGNDVTVSTTDGVVTLTGTVPSHAARERAASLAEQIDGVTRVDNRLALEVNPIESGVPSPTSPDKPADQPGLQAAWTTTKVQAQFFSAPEVKGRTIDVVADANGVVTLRGHVDSAAARSAAVRIAGNTDGVTRVVDELEVAATPDSNVAQEAAAANRDDWITASIQSKYFMDVDVKARHIDVETKNGVVTLSGEVASPAEHRQALDLARSTTFVRDVVDRLALAATTALTGEPRGLAKVVPQLTDETRTPAPPDAWIRTSILSKFFLSKPIQAERVDVVANDGVVTLKGRVRAPEARSAAEEIARGTKGVRRVINQIAVTAS